MKAISIQVPRRCSGPEADHALGSGSRLTAMRLRARTIERTTMQGPILMASESAVRMTACAQGHQRKQR